ncbi:hypothetical protein [Streptomyces sp. NPDC014006]|uniref:hypothetical protein n=1 Tax=Streptomyces sp. NPDC014006 TaxID=3364870 RepID=UPI0037020941
MLGQHAGRGSAGVRGKITGRVPWLSTVCLVPVEFVIDEQAEADGKFVEEPTRPELERFFFEAGAGPDETAGRSQVRC